jgi:hypothetical protein
MIPSNIACCPGWEGSLNDLKANLAFMAMNIASRSSWSRLRIAGGRTCVEYAQGRRRVPAVVEQAAAGERAAHRRLLPKDPACGSRPQDRS